MKTRYILLFSILFIIGACNENTSETDTEQENQQEAQGQIEPDLPTVVIIDDNIVAQNIPEGLELVTTGEAQNLITGDFNGDNHKDFAIMIASENGRDFQDAEDVRIMIFEGNDKGEFELAAKSDNVGGFFIHYAPTSQLKLTKNIISLKHQGMRFDHELKYRYNKKLDNYVLIGSEHNDYGNATNDGSGNISTNYLAGVRLENLNEWNQEKEELIVLPEVKLKVSKTPIPLSRLNEENVLDF